MAQNANTNGLTAAAEERSVRARRKVEEAIATMRTAGEPITFKTVAERAKVSRQYLYDTFKEQIAQLRTTTKRLAIEVDGEKIELRSAGRAATVELVLRNKIARLEAELTEMRKNNNLLKHRYEKALGEAEKWRGQHKMIASELLELMSKLRRRE